MTYDFYKHEWISSQADADRGFPVEELTQAVSLGYDNWSLTEDSLRLHMTLGMWYWSDMKDPPGREYNELFFPHNELGITAVRNLAAAMNRMADEVEKELADAR